MAKVSISAILPKRIGYQLLPGSSTRGGTRALLGAIRALDDGCTIAITPDRSRGPRHDVKTRRGPVRQQRANVMILPLHAVAESAWRFGSWDRMMLPKPFARVDVAYGEPFGVGPGAEGLEAGLRQCASAMACVEQELSS